MPHNAHGFVAWGDAVVVERQRGVIPQTEKPISVAAPPVGPVAAILPSAPPLPKRHFDGIAIPMGIALEFDKGARPATFDDLPILSAGTAVFTLMPRFNLIQPRRPTESGGQRCSAIVPAHTVIGQQDLANALPRNPIQGSDFFKRRALFIKLGHSLIAGTDNVRPEGNCARFGLLIAKPNSVAGGKGYEIWPRSSHRCRRLIVGRAILCKFFKARNQKLRGGSHTASPRRALALAATISSAVAQAIGIRKVQ